MARCDPVLAALAAGDPLDDAASAHLAGCATCRAARDVVAQARPALTAPAPLRPDRGALIAASRRRTARNGAWTAILIGVFAALASANRPETPAASPPDLLHALHEADASLDDAVEVSGTEALALLRLDSGDDAWSAPADLLTDVYDPYTRSTP